MQIALNSCVGRVLRHCGLSLALCLSLYGGAGASVVNGNYVVSGDLQGYAGEGVSLAVSEDSLSGFSSAILQFSYDSSVLSFQGLGSLAYGVQTAAFDAQVGNISTYFLFLSAFVDVDGALTLFSLNFDINNGAAPGDTAVSFSNYYAGIDFSDPSNAGIYDRDSLSGTITVLAAAASGVPIVGTDLLVLSALALMGVAGLRPRQRRLDAC